MASIDYCTSQLNCKDFPDLHDLCVKSYILECVESEFGTIASFTGFFVHIWRRKFAALEISKTFLYIIYAV